MGEEAKEKGGTEAAADWFQEGFAALILEVGFGVLLGVVLGELFGVLLFGVILLESALLEAEVKGPSHDIFDLEDLEWIRVVSRAVLLHGEGRAEAKRAEDGGCVSCVGGLGHEEDWSDGTEGAVLLEEKAKLRGGDAVSLVTKLLPVAMSAKVPEGAAETVALDVVDSSSGRERLRVAGTSDS